MRKTNEMESATAERVLARVDRDAIVELASALIRIPSFSPEETKRTPRFDGEE